MGPDAGGNGGNRKPGSPFRSDDFKLGDEIYFLPSDETDSDDGVSNLSPDGITEFEWGLRGLDCPDCAMKATTVLKRVPGVKEAVVSATEGRVRLKMDVSCLLYTSPSPRD